MLINIMCELQTVGYTYLRIVRTTEIPLTTGVGSEWVFPNYRFDSKTHCTTVAVG